MKRAKFEALSNNERRKRPLLRNREDEVSDTLAASFMAAKG
jgi:hypothetical protein